MKPRGVETTDAHGRTGWRATARKQRFDLTLLVVIAVIPGLFLLWGAVR